MDDFSKLIKNAEKLLQLPGGHKGLILKTDMANYGLSLLRNRFDFLLLVSINKVSKKQFSELERSEYMMYHLANPYKAQQLFVFVPIVQGKKINSTISHWKNSQWYERQLHDVFDLNFKDSKSNWKMFEVLEKPVEKHLFDLSKDSFQLKKLKWKHIPANHKYSFLGKDVFYKKKNGKMALGYIQIGQNRKKREDLYVTGSLNHSLKDFTLSAQVNYLFSLKIALEKFKGVQPSERHQAISMITLESHRVLDHLEALMKVHEKNKLFSSYRTFKKAYEHLHNFFTPSEYDFDFERHLHYFEDSLSTLIPILKDIKVLLNLDNEIPYKNGKIDFGEFRKKDLIDYGVTGILAKSCGIRIDSRKSDSFYLYDALDFKIPLGTQGSLYDQNYVRNSEIKESINMITKLSDNLAVKQKAKEVSLQTLLQECPGLLVGQNVEKSNGLCNLILLSKGTKKESLLVRSPDFNQAQFLSNHLRGLKPFQLHQIGKGLGLNPLEIDR